MWPTYGVSHKWNDRRCSQQTLTVLSTIKKLQWDGLITETIWCGHRLDIYHHLFNCTYVPFSGVLLRIIRDYTHHPLDSPAQILLRVIQYNTI